MLCVSKHILIGITIEHKLQNPQAGGVLKLCSVHRQHLLVLILTLSLSGLYLLSIVLGRKLLNLTEGNNFNERKTHLALNSPSRWDVTTDT